LKERKEKLDKHSSDIDSAFQAIRDVTSMVDKQSVTINKLEECVRSLTDAATKTDERLRKLEKWQNRSHWLQNLGSAAITAAFTAAAVKFFGG
jgi:chromatin segregation and condensation protein Rec8/ScpA/Scc1 (kleisin family)